MDMVLLCLYYIQAWQVQMMLFSMCLSINDTVYEAQGLFICFSHGIYISSLTQGLKDDLMCQHLTLSWNRELKTGSQEYLLHSSVGCGQNYQVKSPLARAANILHCVGKSPPCLSVLTSSRAVHRSWLWHLSSLNGKEERSSTLH